MPSFLFPDASIEIPIRGGSYSFSVPRSKIYKSVFRHNLSEQSLAITEKLGSFFSTRNVIDIGSNVGYAAANYYFSWRPNKIYCFEPSVYNFSYLQKNLQQFKEIELHNIGISDRSADAFLAMPSLKQNARLFRKHNNTGLLSIHGASTLKKEKISLVSLDEWAEEKRIVIKDFFIKIDVEGHEMFALKGMREALKNGNSVQVEINPDALKAAFTSSEEVHAFFAEFNYHPVFAIMPEICDYKAARCSPYINQTHDVVFMKTN